MPEINSSAHRAFVPQGTIELENYFRKYIDANHREKAYKRDYEESVTARIAEPTASRRTIAEVSETERRRVEDDLHDGVQRYIVAALMKLDLAGLGASNTDNEEPMQFLTETRGHLEDGLQALRRTVHGVYSQASRDHGLQAAVEEIVEGYGPHIVVHTPYPLSELEESVLVATYSFRVEVLTSTIKYALNAPTSVLLTSDQTPNISITDQDPGGTKLGHGLRGMKERLATFDGAVAMHSPGGGLTQVIARTPSALSRWESGIGETEGAEMESVEMKGAEKERKLSLRMARYLCGRGSRGSSKNVDMK